MDEPSEASQGCCASGRCCGSASEDGKKGNFFLQFLDYVSNFQKPRVKEPTPAKHNLSLVRPAHKASAFNNDQLFKRRHQKLRAIWTKSMFSSFLNGILLAFCMVVFLYDILGPAVMGGYGARITSDAGDLEYFPRWARFTSDGLYVYLALCGFLHFTASADTDNELRYVYVTAGLLSTMITLIRGYTGLAVSKSASNTGFIMTRLYDNEPVICLSKGPRQRSQGIAILSALYNHFFLFLSNDNIVSSTDDPQMTRMCQRAILISGIVQHLVIYFICCTGLFMIFSMLWSLVKTARGKQQASSHRENGVPHPSTLSSHQHVGTPVTATAKELDRYLTNPQHCDPPSGSVAKKSAALTFVFNMISQPRREKRAQSSKGLHVVLKRLMASIGFSMMVALVEWMWLVKFALLPGVLVVGEPVKLFQGAMTTEYRTRVLMIVIYVIIVGLGLIMTRNARYAPYRVSRACQGIAMVMSVPWILRVDRIVRRGLWAWRQRFNSEGLSFYLTHGGAEVFCRYEGQSSRGEPYEGFCRNLEIGFIRLDMYHLSMNICILLLVLTMSFDLWLESRQYLVQLGLEPDDRVLGNPSPESIMSQHRNVKASIHFEEGFDPLDALKEV